MTQQKATTSPIAGVSLFSVAILFISYRKKKIYKAHKETGTCDPYIGKNASNKTAFEVTQILALENKKFKAVVIGIFQKIKGNHV